MQDGYNTCYAEKALAAHNLRSGYHESKALTLDKAMSKALQKELDDPMSTLTGDTSSRPSIAAECGQNSFEEADPAQVTAMFYNDAATESWYEGKKYYDFKAGDFLAELDGEAVTAEQKAEGGEFTRMVWGETTTVAFGISDRYVFAWYCAPQGNTGAVDNWKKNVKKDCVKDGVDTCYVEMALKAHNEKRARHRGGRPLEADAAASKAIQAELDKEGFSGVINNRPNQFLDCG